MNSGQQRGLMDLKAIVSKIYITYIGVDKVKHGTSTTSYGRVNGVSLTNL